MKPICGDSIHRNSTELIKTLLASISGVTQYFQTKRDLCLGADETQMQGSMHTGLHGMATVINENNMKLLRKQK